MKYILVVGRHKEIMETLTRLINNKLGWVALPALSNEDAKNILLHSSIDLVLLSSGISSQDEHSLKVFTSKHYPDLQVVQHYGGGSGLLYNELQASLVLQN